MSIYSIGLNTGAIVIPEPALQLVGRYQSVTGGFKAIRRGESRFYQRGKNPQAVVLGANTGGTVGGFLDGIIGLILDLAHVLLILAGMYMLWTGLRG